jgi:penicillin-binding protein activator
MQALKFSRVLPVMALSAVMAFGVIGCKRSTTRVAVDSTKDLSGKWNDTDSRLVSEEMIQDVLSRPWLNRFNRKKGKPPTVIIGAVRNLSHEHINTRTFVNDLEKSLINSGEVDFVASASERSEIRSERRDQDLNASEQSRKAMGNEQGADFMLKGTINTIIDSIKGEQVRFYQVDLTLIDLESNRKVWVGQKKIKKVVEQSGFRF